VIRPASAARSLSGGALTPRRARTSGQYRLRHEARADRAVRQQLGQPERVGDVGLAVRHVLPVRGISQNQCEVAIDENVPDSHHGKADLSDDGRKTMPPDR
jgi:hypothetical protein